MKTEYEQRLEHFRTTDGFNNTIASPRNPRVVQQPKALRGGGGAGASRSFYTPESTRSAEESRNAMDTLRNVESPPPPALNLQRVASFTATNTGTESRTNSVLSRFLGKR